MNGPLWSLAYEIQLYAIVFLAFWMAQRRPLLVLVLLIGALVNTLFDSNALLAYGAFGFGFLASWVSLRRTIFSKIGLLLRYMGAVIFVGAAISMGHDFLIDPSYLDRLAKLNSVLMQLGFSLGFAIFLTGAPKFNVLALSFVGKFSYTLYIIHFPILLFFSYALFRYSSLMQSASLAWSIWLMLGVLATFIAYLIGSHIEQPKRQKAKAMQRYQFKLLRSSLKE